MKFWGNFRSFFVSIKNSPARITVAVCLLVVFVFALGFVTYSASYSKIMPNTWIDDVCIGKLTREDAKAVISRRFAQPLEERELTLKCQSRATSVLFKDLGVLADVDKTVENAFQVGRSFGPFSKTAVLVKSFFSKTVLPLSVTSDPSEIDRIITNLAKGYETHETDPSYSIDDNVLTISRGSKGKKINREAALSKITKAAGDRNASVVTLEIEDAEPKAFDIDKLYEELSAPSQDAYYKYENGNVSVVDEKIEVIVDKGEIEKAFSSSLQTISIPVKTKVPEKTAEELKSLLFRDTLASYSSSFATSSEARAANVRISASKINEYILMPGDVFSYDKTIGKRTASNGYREANVYIGNKVETGIGGGICQTSSTLYSAVLYANLEIVSRTSHSLPVSYVPAGQDATIAEGYIDLLFKNNTEYPIKLVAVTNGRTLTCKILGVKVPNQSVELFHTRISTSKPGLERSVDETVPLGYKITTNKGADGYTITSKRVVKNNGEIIKTENLSKSVYNAASIEETVNPADKDTPSAELIEYSEDAFIATPPQAPDETVDDETTHVSGDATTDASEPEPSSPDETVTEAPETMDASSSSTESTPSNNE